MGKLTNLNPFKALTEADLPSTVTFDTELLAAITGMIKMPATYNTVGNIDNLSTVFESKDANIDGIVKGWHFITILRTGDSAYGVQVAFCDTQNNVKYRRKTSGVWQPWVTMV